MPPELTPEQSNAIGQELQIEMVDPITGRTFLVIEKSFYAINNRERNLASIERGLNDMEAGRGRSLAQSQASNLDRLKHKYSE